MTLPQTIIDHAIKLQREIMKTYEEDELKGLTAVAFARAQQAVCEQRIRELQQSKESLQRAMAK